MMPMLFCASLVPCPRLYPAAETSCRRRNHLSTRCGGCLCTAQLVITVTITAITKPINGARKMNRMGLTQPLPMIAAVPALDRAAPPYPPISAGDELVGKPRISVNKFQEIAPSRPAIRTYSLTISMRTKPPPMVLATAVPKINAATKFQNAAHRTAQSGFRTRVETIVAIELAASCQPFEKSKASVMNTMAMSRGKLFTGQPSPYNMRRHRLDKAVRMKEVAGICLAHELFRVTDSITLATSSHLSAAVSITSIISFHL